MEEGRQPEKGKNASFIPKLLLDKRELNVLYVGFCFFIIGIPATAIVSVQTLMLSEDSSNVHNLNGFICFTVNFLCLSATFPFASFILAKTGSVGGIIVGAFGDLLYNVAFYFDTPWIVYGLCAVSGVTHAILRTGQGVYLMENSRPHTLQRDNTLFWWMQLASQLIGQIILLLLLRATKIIDHDTRILILDVTVAINLFGFFLSLFISRPSRDPDLQKAPAPVELQQEIRKTWEVFMDSRMLLLIPSSIFTGLLKGFSQSVYPSAVGFTLSLTEYSASLTALSGIYIGAGLIMGGAIQFVRRWEDCFSLERTFFCSVGTLSSLAAFALAYANLPDNSVFGDTEDLGPYTNSVTIALMCSFMIGVGLMYVMNNVPALICLMFQNNPAHSVAAFNFTRFVAEGIYYYYCTIMSLSTQLLLLGSSAVTGLLLFIPVDYKYTLSTLPSSKKDGKKPNSNDVILEKY
nr:PREDICTED: UNC93-like protein MFSD11 [Bemisia tabaci]